MSLSQRQIQQNVSAATENKSCVSAHQSFRRDVQDREADLGVKLNRVNLSFVSHSARCPDTHQPSAKTDDTWLLNFSRTISTQNCNLRATEIILRPIGTSPWFSSQSETHLCVSCVT